MNQNQLQQLLDFTGKNYHGISVSPQQFNLLRELAIFKAFAFDQMKGNDYEVWVVESNLKAFVAKGILTEDDVTMDIAFIASYLNIKDDDVEKTSKFIGLLVKIYKPMVSPDKSYDFFERKVACKIGQMCDIYA